MPRGRRRPVRGSTAQDGDSTDDEDNGKDPQDVASKIKDDLHAQERDQAQPVGEGIRGEFGRTYYDAFKWLKDADVSTTEYETYCVGEWVYASLRQSDEEEHPELDGIGQILRVFVNRHGLLKVAMRYAWQYIDILEEGEYEDPDMAPQHKRQIFVQKDVCQDGRHYVTGRGGSGWRERLPIFVISRHCVVQHVDDIRPPHFDSIQGFEQRDDHWWYHLLFDHVTMRFEHMDPLPHPAHTLEAPSPVYKRLQAPPRFLDLFCGAGAVSRAAIDEGFEVLGGVDIEKNTIGAYTKNIHKAGSFTNCFDRAMTVEELVSRVREGRLSEEEQQCLSRVDCLWASPPCQSLSLMKMFYPKARNYQAAYDEFVGEARGVIPQIMYLLSNITRGDGEKIPYFALEEVVQFISTIFYDKEGDKEGGEEEEAPVVQEGNRNKGGGRRKVFRALMYLMVKLLDEGYQLDVRVLNSVYYQVPQDRKRLILCAALPGYELPTPPPPRCRTPPGVNAYAQCSDKKRTLRVPHRGWEGIYVLPAPEQQGLQEEITVQEAIDDLKHTAEGTAGVYRPPAGGVSKYARYMRAAVPSGGPLTDHQRRDKNGNEVQKTLEDEGHLRTQGGGVSCTLCTGFGRNPRLLHYELDRYMTVAERKRLQSLPDDFVLEGNVGHKAKQLGNAVPYLMGRAVLRQIAVAATGSALVPDNVPNLKSSMVPHTPLAGQAHAASPSAGVPNTGASDRTHATGGVVLGRPAAGQREASTSPRDAHTAGAGPSPNVPSVTRVRSGDADVARRRGKRAATMSDGDTPGARKKLGVSEIVAGAALVVVEKVEQAGPSRAPLGPAGGPVGPPQAHAGPSSTAEVIDLTLDSDSDGDDEVGLGRSRMPSVVASNDGHGKREAVDWPTARTCVQGELSGDNSAVNSPASPGHTSDDDVIIVEHAPAPVGVHNSHTECHQPHNATGAETDLDLDLKFEE